MMIAILGNQIRAFASSLGDVVALTCIVVFTGRPIESDYGAKLRGMIDRPYAKHADFDGSLVAAPDY